jgi:hypothetical protein
MAVPYAHARAALRERPLPDQLVMPIDSVSNVSPAVVQVVEQALWLDGEPHALQLQFQRAQEWS